MKNKLIKFLSLFSVLILIVFCFCFNISAAETVSVNYTNPNNIPYDVNSLLISADQMYTLSLGGDSVIVPVCNSLDLVVTVVNEQFLSDEGITFSVPGVSDGMYIAAFAYDCYSFQIDGQTYSYAIVPGSIIVSFDDELVGVSFKFYDALPELISIEVVDDSSALYKLSNFVFVPYEAPKPIDSVSNV